MHQDAAYSLCQFKLQGDASDSCTLKRSLARHHWKLRVACTALPQGSWVLVSHSVTSKTCDVAEVGLGKVEKVCRGQHAATVAVAASV